MYRRRGYLAFISRLFRGCSFFAALCGLCAKQKTTHENHPRLPGKVPTTSDTRLNTEHGGLNRSLQHYVHITA